MTTRSASHDTFVIERTYDAPPSRVFAAFADPAIKARWFGGIDDFEKGKFELDFRVGGREVNAGGPPGGPLFTYEATYNDIVPNERIVYSYQMHMDDALISVSVATFEFRPDGSGTHLVLTEQGVFLDGLDYVAEREHGTRELLDALGKELASQAATV